MERPTKPGPGGLTPTGGRNYDLGHDSQIDPCKSYTAPAYCTLHLNLYSGVHKLALD